MVNEGSEDQLNIIINGLHTTMSLARRVTLPMLLPTPIPFRVQLQTTVAP
jgi:hypothetical protein